jgi:hypothetical protein
MALKVMAFEPGVFIEVNDAFGGGRKLVRVCEDGKSFEDLAEGEPTAFPIFEQLQPAEAGNILGWGLYLTDKHPAEQPQFRILVDELLSSGRDTLTYTRAAHWAFMHRNYDLSAALKAGDEATERVRMGRARMDAVIDAAEGQE